MGQKKDNAIKCYTIHTRVFRPLFLPIECVGKVQRMQLTFPNVGRLQYIYIGGYALLLSRARPDVSPIRVYRRPAQTSYYIRFESSSFSSLKKQK